MKDKPTRGEYEEALNDIGIPLDDTKSEGGRIPDYAKYGTWIRRNDKIAFNVGYNNYEIGTLLFSQREEEKRAAKSITRGDYTIIR